MTISTQQSKIPHISFPIFEASRPSILSVFRSYFLSWVNMVYIKQAEVINPAFNTLPAKFRHNIKFAFPVVFMCMCFKAMSTPIRLLAVQTTEARKTGYSASLAFTTLIPARLHIAISTTKNRLISPRSRLLDIKRFTALFANNILSFFFSVSCYTFKPFIPRGFFNRVRAQARTVFSSLAPIKGNLAFKACVVNLFHSASIYYVLCLCKYFDIACKRIEEAYKSPDMFIEAAKKPTQEALF